jgi:hypothetical protein
MPKGCPRLVRSDCWTENCLMAAAQVAFQAEGGDNLAGAKSYRYGQSTTNTVRTVILFQVSLLYSKLYAFPLLH